MAEFLALLQLYGILIAQVEKVKIEEPLRKNN